MLAKLPQLPASLAIKQLELLRVLAHQSWPLADRDDGDAQRPRMVVEVFLDIHADRVSALVQELQEEMMKKKKKEEKEKEEERKKEEKKERKKEEIVKMEDESMMVDTNLSKEKNDKCKQGLASLRTSHWTIY